MNMNDFPTTDQLRTLVAPVDDQAGHHIVWIDKFGLVQLIPWMLTLGRSPLRKGIGATCSSGIRRLIRVTGTWELRRPWMTSGLPGCFEN